MTKPRVIQPGETRYGVLMSEAEAIDLVSGWVPYTLRAKILALLDHEREQERMNESRPFEPTKDRGPTKRRKKRKSKKVMRADQDAGLQ